MKLRERVNEKRLNGDILIFDHQFDFMARISTTEQYILQEDLWSPI